MNFKQSFIMALKSLASSKMRSFLTMLGIIIGVASVIILVSLVDGMKNEISKTFKDMGTNMITVMVMGRGSSRTVNPDDMMSLVDKHGEYLLACSPNATISATVKVGSENLSTTVYGVSETYNKIRKAEVETGRFLEFVDVERIQKVCVIGSYIAQELYVDSNPIGREIKINNDVYTVIGVLEETASSKEGTDDDKIFIPYTNASRLANINSYFFGAVDETTVDKGIQEITAALTKIFGNSDAFRISSQEAILEMVNEVTGQMTMLLVGIAAISLLVGGIGIMNIMLVSVTERISEIGIRKSLGAKRKDIRNQFVVEAATSSSIGGIFGIILGGIGGVAIGNIIGITVYPSPSAVAIAFGVSAFIGILFGYAPANKAAKLNPIDALRHD